MLLLIALSGCWKTEADITFDVVPFQNDLVASETGVVETLVTDLSCPDGEPAKIVLVYDSTWEDARPAAIVLHSSAFDYVLNPQAESALTGSHWAGTTEDGVHRMSQAWGVQKVWETLGMYPQVEPAETNLGALPTAILDAGMVGIYPTNCWGDLWHNSSTDVPNDRGSEYLDREGGTYAWWMVRFLRDATFASTQNITPSVRIDGQSLYLFGLGDGALGVADLLRHEEMPAISGVYLDSPIDDLDQWAETAGVDEGLARIYWSASEGTGGASTSDYSAWSITQLVIDKEFQDFPSVLVHSSVDPRVPAGNLDALVAKIANKNESGASNVCVVDTGAVSHVQSNADLPLAKDLVDFLLGASSSRCATDDGGSDTGG